MREPVLSGANDYTEWSGPQRVRDLMGDEAEELLERRFAIIQVWRAIRQPISSNPLAMADARRSRPTIFLIAERRYPNRVGQTYRLKYNPAHAGSTSRDAARRGDRLQGVRLGEGRPRALHAAHSFDDPTTPPGAPPRQSIEARAPRILLNIWSLIVIEYALTVQAV